jgi:hypothetical protein
MTMLPVLHGVRTIRLTQGFNVLVDQDDVEILSRHRWKVLKVCSKIYASRTRTMQRPARKSITILMHRQITGVVDGLYIDHHNGDGLDNRRSNLRTCTQSQNLANRFKTSGQSRFKGVYWNKKARAWHAQIASGVTADGRQKVLFLGHFDDESDAALAYDRKAIELRGEFARLNLPGLDDGRVLRRVARPKRDNSGERHHLAKIDRVGAAEIKRRAMAGENQSTIAADFGVSSQLVSAIKTGVAWRGL